MAGAALDRPRAYFLGKLTLPCGYIMPNGQTKEEMSNLATMVGTGGNVVVADRVHGDVVFANDELDPARPVPRQAIGEASMGHHPDRLGRRQGTDR